MSAVPPTPSSRTVAPVLRKTIPIRAEDLRHGMFVTALDRPWEGTPFLLQGFMIDSAEQMEALQALCTAVVIDPGRSAHASLKDVLNLFELPQDDPVPEVDENAVRIRFVENARRTVPLKTAPLISLGQISGVMRGALNRLKPSTLGDVMSARQARLEKVAQASARPERATSNMPRFSRSQIVYAPTEQQPGAPKRGAKRRARSTLKPRTPRSRKKEVARASRQSLRFDSIVAALYPNWSQFIPRFSFLSSAGARAASFWQKREPRVARRALAQRTAARKAPTKRAPLELVIYRDSSDTETEVYRAREAVDAVLDALNALRGDINAESTVRLDGLPVSVEALVDSVSRNPDALEWVTRVRLRDTTIYTHGIKVAAYLLAFGRHLGYPPEQLSQLALIGLLMDVGKQRVDPAVLNKTGVLSIEELGQIQEHVALGLGMLSESLTLHPAVRDGIAQHHEWVDGNGYPEGRSGEQISVFGRMAAIADAFAALTTHRPHARPISSYDALRVIFSLAGRQFYEPLVEQFVQAIGVFPVGSLVMLSSGAIAVIVGHDKVRRLEPRILVLTTPDLVQMEEPYPLDLLRHPKDAKGQPIKILRSIPAGAYGINFSDFFAE